MSAEKEKLYPSDIRRIGEELNLPQAHRHILHVIHSYQGGNPNSWPSLTKLARAVGVSKRHLIRMINDLEERGVLTRERRGHLTNLYRVVTSRSLPGSDTHVTRGGDAHVTKGVTPMSPGSDICDTEKCHKCLPAQDNPETQKSKKKSEKKSVNQSGKNDGLMTDQKTSLSSNKKPALKKFGDALVKKNGLALVDSYRRHFAPPPGAPPRLTPKQVKAIFGGPGPRLVNLLDCPEDDVDLSYLVAPFKGLEVFEIIGFNPDISQVEWFEKALKEFYREVIDRHWSKKATPPGAPFRRLFFKAGRSGLLYEFGFRPLSPEELKRQKEKAAKAARIRENEKRREAKKERAREKFFNKQIVRSYFDFLGFPPRDHQSMLDHIREIASQFNGQATIKEIENFMRETLQNEMY